MDQNGKCFVSLNHKKPPTRLWHSGVNPLAPRDVSGRTYFSADFFLSTDFKEIKMPNLSIQPYKIGLEQ